MRQESRARHTIRLACPSHMAMSCFQRKNGILHVEDVSLLEMARQLPTPFYCYSLTSFADRYCMVREAFASHAIEPHIAYAVKANGHLPCLAALSSLQCHADIVSEGEMHRCLRAAIQPERIIFSGVGKTSEEITNALQHGIGQFNVESAEELHTLASIASQQKKRAAVALRVNPDIHAPTHDKIATARRDDKFGIAPELIPSLCRLIADHESLQWRGLAVHLGSQIFSSELYGEAARALLALDKELVKQSLPASPQFDVGGGIGCSTKQEIDLAAYAHQLSAVMDRPFVIEPGRFIAAPSGILVSRVVRIKHARPHSFVIVDAAMNDLLRPALYDGHHPLETIDAPSQKTMSCHVVGPICESADTFLRDVTLPELKAGDYVAFMHSGAYGAVMASSYNTRPLVAEVCAQKNHWAISKKSVTVQDMLTCEQIPSWLAS